MATAAKTVYPHISKDPMVCSGRACVEGTRVRVMDIVAMSQEGMTPEQIARQLPSLKDTSDVYAALLYYADHKDEIEADFADSDRVAEEGVRQEAEQLKRQRG